MGMNRWMLAVALFSTGLLWPRASRAAVSMQSGPALASAQQASLESDEASEAASLEGARVKAGKTMDGGSAASEASMVEGREGQGLRHGLAARYPQLAMMGGGGVPPPNRGPQAAGRKRIPTWAVYGGAAVLGALQGGLAAGLAGALGGAVLGLGAAWLYERGDFGGAFGLTAGGIIGSFLGGPLGGLIGAAIGGLIGHALGKLVG